jgi:hypothetical protein
MPKLKFPEYGDLRYAVCTSLYMALEVVDEVVMVVTDVGVPGAKDRLNTTSLDQICDEIPCMELELTTQLLTP